MWANVTKSPGMVGYWRRTNIGTFVPFLIAICDIVIEYRDLLPIILPAWRICAAAAVAANRVMTNVHHKHH